MPGANHAFEDKCLEDLNHAKCMTLKSGDITKKSPGTWHVGAQGGRDDDLGCWGDEGIAVSVPIIDKDGFNTVN